MRPAPAGILLAVFGMVAFGVYHWFYVAPVAVLFVEGLLWAAAIGALVGKAYHQTMLARGRSGVWWGIVFGALFALTLVPSEIVGLLWGPFPEIADPGDFFAVLPLAFVGVPFAVILAWWLRRPQVAWWFVAAVAVGHAMLGGSIANFGGRGDSLVLFWGAVVFETAAGGMLAVLVGRPEDAPEQDPTRLSSTGVHDGLRPADGSD